jgi:error-prone DNA polymerase
VKHLSNEGGGRIAQAHAAGPFAGVQELAERAKLDAKDLAALASAGALRSLARHRHRARWDVAGVEKPTALLERIRITEGEPLLKRPTEGEDVAADYRHLGLTLGRHPLALLRRELGALRLVDAQGVRRLARGERVRTAGLVITRQRPSSAAGVTFVTLEDESGYLNLIVWEKVAERCRRALLGASLLGVTGRVQKEGEVLHVVVERLFDLSELLARIDHGGLVAQSRDFH